MAYNLKHNDLIIAAKRLRTKKNPRHHATYPKPNGVEEEVARIDVTRSRAAVSRIVDPRAAPQQLIWLVLIIFGVF